MKNSILSFPEDFDWDLIEKFSADAFNNILKSQKLRKQFAYQQMKDRHQNDDNEWMNIVKSLTSVSKDSNISLDFDD